MTRVQSLSFGLKPFLDEDPETCLEVPLKEGAIGLHVGCGSKKWPGWVNVDSDDASADIKANARSLPFPDNHADVLCSIHMIEHVYEWEAADILSEFRRVLKEGGRLILELPSMDKIFGYIAHCTSKNLPMSVDWTSWALWGNPKLKRPEMCHRWGYTTITMKKLLQKVGFKNVVQGVPLYHVPPRDMRFEAIK